MINIRRIGESITGSFNGQHFGVAYSEEKYKAMQALAEKANAAETIADLKPILEEFEPLTRESYKELVESKTPYIHINKATNKFFLKWNNTVSSKSIPEPLVNRVLEAVDKNEEILPVVKTWVRLLRNPFFSDDKASRFANYINVQYVNDAFMAKLINEHGVSPLVAQERATSTQVPITQEGLISTYKVSEEIDWRFVANEDGTGTKRLPRYAPVVDEISGALTYALPEYMEDRLFRPAIMKDSGDAFWCGTADGGEMKQGHIIKVGAFHWLDSWDQVNTDDQQSGVKGLHVGNLDYIRGFQNNGTITHYTFVDPMDIGAIPCDRVGAIRVKRYYTYGSFMGVTRSLYHSSHLAAITDKEFDAMVQKAVQDTLDKQDAISRADQERQSLIIT